MPSSGQKMPNIIGYIVKNNEGNGLTLGNYGDSRGSVLCHGDEVALFRNYESARSAIKRSKRYAASYNLPWRCDLFKIIKVIDAE